MSRFVELSESFEAQVKASKSVKRFKSYSHLKFLVCDMNIRASRGSFRVVGEDEGGGGVLAELGEGVPPELLGRGGFFPGCGGGGSSRYILLSFGRWRSPHKNPQISSRTPPKPKSSDRHVIQTP